MVSSPRRLIDYFLFSSLTHSQGLEPLFIDPTVRTPIQSALRESVRQSHASTVHLILVVGRKLVTSYRGPLGPELTQSEVLLLLVQAESEGVRRAMMRAGIVYVPTDTRLELLFSQ